MKADSHSLLADYRKIIISVGLVKPPTCLEDTARDMNTIVGLLCWRVSQCAADGSARLLRAIWLDSRQLVITQAGRHGQHGQLQPS